MGHHLRPHALPSGAPPPQSLLPLRWRSCRHLSGRHGSAMSELFYLLLNILHHITAVHFPITMSHSLLPLPAPVCSPVSLAPSALGQAPQFPTAPFSPVPISDWKLDSFSHAQWKCLLCEAFVHLCSQTSVIEEERTLALHRLEFESQSFTHQVWELSNFLNVCKAPLTDL